MARKTKEWIGKTDDTPAPDYVKIRVFLRADGICAHCSRKIVTGEKWELDHEIALVNGGANRESNLRPLHWGCHTSKSGEDLATKALTFRKRKAHYGIKKPKGRPMPGTRRSGLRKRMSGKVERWD